MTRKNHLQIIVDERTDELHKVNLRLEQEHTARQLSEEKLGDQYTLLKALINSSNKIIIFSLDVKYCYTAFNDMHHEEMKQLWNTDIKVGMNLLECLHRPEIKELTKLSIDRALKGESFSEIQYQRESEIYYEFNWNPVFQNKKVVGITAFKRDITLQKQNEIQIVKLNRIYSVLKNINQAIVRIHETEELLSETCRVAVECGMFRMAWIGKVNLQTKKVDVVASNGFSGDYLKKIDIDLNDDIRSSGPTGITIKTARSKISNNIANDDSMIPWREDAHKYGYESCASFPLIVFDKVIGAFTLYSDEIDYFEEDDISLLNEMAKDISFALEFIESETQRKQAEQHLINSEREFRTLAENVPANIIRYDKDCRAIFINHKSEAAKYFTSTIIGKTPLEIRKEGLASVGNYQEILQQVIATGKPGKVEISLPDLKDNAHVYEVNIVAEHNYEGQIIGALAIGHDITERQRNDAINTSRLYLLQFAATHTVDELLEETLNEAERLTGSLIGFYHFVEDDQVSLTLQNWSTRTKAMFCKAEGKGQHYAISQAGVWVDCVFRQKPVIHNDYASLPHRKGMPEGHAKVIRELIVPVLRGKKIKAILGIGNKPTDYLEKDTETISLLANLAWEIVERKQVEGTLAKTTVRLKEAQRIAQMGSWELDIINNILTWSDEIFRIFEVDPNMFSASYEAFLETIHPDDREAVNFAYTNSIETRSPYSIDHRLLLQDGRIKYVHEQCETFFDPDGKPLRSIGTVQDITDRKQEEEERQNHVWFMESLDRVTKAIQGTDDLDRMMKSVLETVLSIFGCDRAWLFYPCDPDALFFRVPMEITKPEYPGAGILNVDLPMPPDMAQNLRETLESTDPVTYTAGTESPVNKVTAGQFGVKSQIMVALYPKSGKPWVFGLHHCSIPHLWTEKEKKFFKEISSRISDGLSSLLFLRDLKDSEKRYRLVFENSPVSIWEEDLSGVRAILDDLKKDGINDIETYFAEHPEVVQQCVDVIKITDINRAALSLHKAADKNQLLAGLVNIFTPESFDTFRHELICLWKGEIEVKRDAVVRTLAGDPRNVTVYFSVCPGYKESLSKVLVSTTDITDRKRAEEDIQKLNQELERRVTMRTEQLHTANKELEAFAYSVSHDLRAPLRHINGFLELLQKATATTIDEQGRHYMSIIADSSNRMGELIDDLLSFSRMGRQEMLKMQVDLNKLVREVIHELEAGPQYRNIHWQVEVLPTVAGDYAMLRIVFVNLISNAMKFTSTRQHPKIEIGCNRDNEAEIVVFIRDNGVGFDPKYTNKLYGVFQRLHTEEEFEGTGIGLANVQRIINRHNGRTWAEGMLDKGATFYVALPGQS